MIKERKVLNFRDVILHWWKRIFIFYSSLTLIFLSGCGYTTRSYVYTNRKIYIEPVSNEVKITSQKRVYSSYTPFPLLLEKKLTSAVINKFNTDGHLKVVKEQEGALQLKCIIDNYQKEALRYSNNDAVTEQKLRLYVKVKLYLPDGTVLKERRVIGETTYFLSGQYAKSETSANEELIQDTARKIVEAVIEQW